MQECMDKVLNSCSKKEVKAYDKHLIKLYCPNYKMEKK